MLGFFLNFMWRVFWYWIGWWRVYCYDVLVVGWFVELDNGEEVNDKSVLLEVSVMKIGVLVIWGF